MDSYGYECMDCEKTFTRHQDAKRHEKRSKHAVAFRVYKAPERCGFCGEYIHPSNIEKHVKLCRG